MKNIFLILCPLTFGLWVLAVPGCQQTQDRSEADRGDQLPVSNIVDSLWLVLEYAPEDADTFALESPAEDTLTALELLTRIADRHHLTLQTQHYAFGTLVTRIRDRSHGEGGHWLYTVNGESIPSAVSAHRLRPGDTTRFFFAGS